MKMEGEISELSVTKPESGAKAELGGVSACAIEVAQAVPPPMIEPVHPEGVERHAEEQDAEDG